MRCEVANGGRLFAKEGLAGAEWDVGRIGKEVVAASIFIASGSKHIAFDAVSDTVSSDVVLYLVSTPCPQTRRRVRFAVCACPPPLPQTPLSSSSNSICRRIVGETVRKHLQQVFSSSLMTLRHSRALLFIANSCCGADSGRVSQARQDRCSAVFAAAR